MVRITLFVEGGGNADHANGNNNALLFRENFHKLFSQRLSDNEFELVIEPIGSVNRARTYLERITNKQSDGVLLIDLDAPKDQKQKRIEDNYKGLDVGKLFFMIQEMEAWILSQPDKIVAYAKKENLSHKQSKGDIANHSLIKGIHPEDIQNPSGKLNTILREHFEEQKVRRGKLKQKPKSYSKMKDGPDLIGLLNLQDLANTFDEVENMMVCIEGFSS